MAGRLTDADMNQLEAWIDTGPKTFQLLYSITRDGCVSSTFHQKCDNQGPTVTVLYTQQNAVFGGYTSVNWNSNGAYVKDSHAFLYQLQFSGKSKVNKFPVTKVDNAIYSNASYGPTFGMGHDLYAFSGTLNSAGGYFIMNGYMTDYFGSSYDAHGLKPGDVNNSGKNVTELEVYKVDDAKREKRVPQPWREAPELSKKFLAQLVKEIEEFKPVSEADISEFRILMIGPVGSGKSSFYNTVNSSFVGRITQRAICGTSVHSVTTSYTPYSITTQSGTTLKFRLCDTRGVEETQGLDMTECEFLVSGHIPEFYQFNPAAHMVVQSKDFVKTPRPSDEVHCVVFVMDASTLDEIKPDVLRKLKGFRNIMNLKQIPQAVLLTKIDKVTEQPIDIFYDKQIKQKVDDVSKLLGVPRNNVLPVKNYEHETEVNDNVDALALLALRQILHFAQDYMHNLVMKQHSGVSTQYVTGNSESEICESDTA